MDSTDSNGQSTFQFDSLPPEYADSDLERAASSPAGSSDHPVESQDAGSLQFILRLPPGMRVRLTVETMQGENEPAARAVFLSSTGAEGDEPFVARLPLPLPVKNSSSDRLPEIAPAFQPALPRTWTLSLPVILFGVGLIVYLAVRLIGLSRFPIYFFTDEAVQTVLAADFLRDEFRNYAGDFLPAFFENGGKYRLGVTVYLHAISFFLFGKSVFITRATSVLLSTGAAAAIALAARRVFRLPYWWSAVLFLSITPAWFLHSRTAFEYAAGTAFYALFLLFYLLYRCENPRYLIPALLMGGLSFYAYSPLQVVVLVSGALFFLFDLRYHWKHRRAAAGSLLVLILLALPYIRFLLEHGGENARSLRALGSYWTESLPILEKLRLFSAAYLEGLNPWFWYNRTPETMERHLMKGYAYMPPQTFPLALAGLGLALRNGLSKQSERQPAAHRTVLLSLLAAPTGAALVEPGVTRLLVMVVPVTLLVVIGADAGLRYLERYATRFSVSQQSVRGLLSVSLFALLAVINVAMLRDALINGPTWFTNYGLGGMQYGAVQAFGEVQEYLTEKPDTQIIFSPTWANGTDVLARYMLGDPLPLQIGSIEGYLNHHLPLEEDTLFVMTPEEYEKALTSDKFASIQVERTLPYPNGQPGFYFVRLSYVDEVDEIFAREAEARRALLEEEVPWQGQNLRVRYPMLDIGSIDKILDGDPNTLARTFEANPFRIEVIFQQPIQMGGYSIIIGSAQVELTAVPYNASGVAITQYRQRAQGSVEQPVVFVPFLRPVEVSRIDLSIQDLSQREPGHVHVWEVDFKGADFRPDGSN